MKLKMEGRVESKMELGMKEGVGWKFRSIGRCSHAEGKKGHKNDKGGEANRGTKRPAEGDAGSKDGDKSKLKWFGCAEFGYIKANGPKKK